MLSYIRSVLRVHLWFLSSANESCQLQLAGWDVSWRGDEKPDHHPCPGTDTEKPGCVGLMWPSAKRSCCFKLFTNVSKIGLCFTEGAELSCRSAQPVKIQAYVTGTMRFASFFFRNLSKVRKTEAQNRSRKKGENSVKYRGVVGKLGLCVCGGVFRVASPDLSQNVTSWEADVTFQPSSWMTTNCRFRPRDQWFRFASKIHVCLLFTSSTWN